MQQIFIESLLHAGHSPRCSSEVLTAVWRRKLRQGKVVGPGREWRSRGMPSPGSVHLLSGVRHQGSGPRPWAEHRGWGGTEMLVEVAGGGPIKKRILKKYFTSFPCCLVFQKPVLSTGTTLQQPPFHGSRPHPGGLGSFLLFSHPPTLPARAKRHLPPIFLPPSSSGSHGLQLPPLLSPTSFQFP